VHWNVTSTIEKRSDTIVWTVWCALFRRPKETMFTDCVCADGTNAVCGQSCYLPHRWTHPTYGAKRHPDPIRRFPPCTGQTDAQTDRSSTGKFDHYRVPRYTKATRPNNNPLLSGPSFNTRRQTHVNSCCFPKNMPLVKWHI